MQPSCPGLSLVKRAEFMVMTLRQSSKQSIQWKSEEQGQEHAYNFSLISRGLFTEILSWQAKQPILHTTMTFTATL
jgi:hypothetical protein